MSWHYLPGLAAESSAVSCLDGAPSVPSRSKSTRARSSSKDSATDCSSPSQSGTTSRPSTGDPGLDLWMCVQRAGRVRTSQQREKEQASKEPEAVSGWKWPASWGRFDPGTSLVRIRQCCLLTGDGAVYSETLQRWGMMRDGELLALDMPEHLIEEIGSGLWPTPYASDVRTYRLNAPGRQSHDRSLCSIMRREEQGHLCPDWVEGYLMGWPIGWTSLEPIGWGDWWDQTWWDEEPCPRITTIKTNRVNRLKAIGNGQVPACVVMAWELLHKKPCPL